MRRLELAEWPDLLKQQQTDALTNIVAFNIVPTIMHLRELNAVLERIGKAFRQRFNAIDEMQARLVKKKSAQQQGVTLYQSTTVIASLSRTKAETIFKLEIDSATNSLFASEWRRATAIAFEALHEQNLLNIDMDLSLSLIHI